MEGTKQEETKKSYIQMSDGLVIVLDTTTPPITEIMRFYSPIPLKEEYPPKPHPIPPELKEKWQEFDNLYDPRDYGTKIPNIIQNWFKKKSEEEKEYLLQIKKHFANSDRIHLFANSYGLSVELQIDKNTVQFQFSLAHLSKERIITLINNGKLSEEIKFLYHLAYFPYAESHTLNAYTSDNKIFDIIDRVILRFEKVPNPLSEKTYKSYHYRNIHSDYRFSIKLPHNEFKVKEGIDWIEKHTGKNIRDIT